MNTNMNCEICGALCDIEVMEAHGGNGSDVILCPRCQAKAQRMEWMLEARQDREEMREIFG